MTPVRVLLIAPSIDIVGGQAIQAQLIVNGLRGEPSIAVEFLPINQRAPGILRPLQRVKYVRTALTFTLYFMRLLFSAWRCDIVHIFSAAYYGYAIFSLPAIIVGRLFGKKVILNYHDGQCEDHLRNWRLAVPTLRLAHEIVTPSPFLLEVITRFGLHACCVSNVLDVDHFKYRKRKHLRPVFMSNRGLEPLYNVDCILRAFDIIRRSYPDATLTVAHDGPSRPRLEALARELKLENAHFIGTVPHERVPTLYDDADIYLTSPNVDNTPGSPLECFASGLPVVATRAGGIPYIIESERTGLLVPIDDHEALAQACFRLLEDPELVERLTLNARQECERYRWERIRGGWVSLYQELSA